MAILNVPLPDEAAAELRKLANRELRPARLQAAVLIMEGLRRAALEATPAPRSGDAPRAQPK